MHRSLLSAVLSLSVLLSTLVAAQDAEYTFTTIDAPGSTSTLAFGINAAGQIVGGFSGGPTGNHGFLWDGMTFTNIDVPDARFTTPQGINNLDQIVGSFSDFTDTTSHGFLKDGETFTTFDVPSFIDARNIVVYGINDEGQMVGTINRSVDEHHGFLIDGDTFTLIDVPGAFFTFVFGINNGSNHLGQIVGYFREATGRDRGFLKDGETFTVFDLPDGRTAYPYGINDEGQIVGFFFGDTGRRGFLKDGETFTTIHVSDAFHTQAYGINNAGQIVGTSEGATGSHGFVATPVDKTPPMITTAASPTTLSPPNGKLVTVIVSGTITDEPEGSVVSSGAYQVTDEYDQIEPSGTFTPNAEADGSYSYAFTVALQASRRGNDPNGRQYRIVVSATDTAGNSGSTSATVTVPRN